VIIATDNHTRVLFGDQDRNEVYEIHIPKFSVLIFACDMFHAGAKYNNKHIIDVNPDTGVWDIQPYQSTTNPKPESIFRFFAYCNVNNVLPKDHSEEGLHNQVAFSDLSNNNNNITNLNNIKNNSCNSENNPQPKRYQMLLEGKITNDIIQSFIQNWNQIKLNQVMMDINEDDEIE
jgi:hypothetical protein